MTLGDDLWTPVGGVEDTLSAPIHYDSNFGFGFDPIFDFDLDFSPNGFNQIMPEVGNEMNSNNIDFSLHSLDEQPNIFQINESALLLQTPLAIPPLPNLASEQPRTPCPICSATFARPKDLRRHMGKHGGRNIKCTFPGCDKTFYRLDKLYAHERSGAHARIGRRG
ncbi:hypothetical protein B0J11DRAFT_278414 [Dendryphion nanum]|uniref:C2H2-type domain-containing protein n=1 Tax=Dendryphion nanum TaxID=256645 RepID=A0A9P9E0Q7_9PLEO|nr:hypothetical protein B0J11DRAFT_278414 [Dendryphion nanum]